MKRKLNEMKKELIFVEEFALMFSERIKNQILIDRWPAND